MPELEIGQKVRMQPLGSNAKTAWKKGECLKKVGPRSYLIETEDGIYRRNRKHIRTTCENATDTTTPSIEKLSVRKDETTSIESTSENKEKKPSIEKTPIKKKGMESSDTKDSVSMKSSTPKSTRSKRNIKLPSKFKDYEMS